MRNNGQDMVDSKIMRTDTLGGVANEGLSLTAICYSVKCKGPGRIGRPRQVELDLADLVSKYGRDRKIHSLSLTCSKCGSGAPEVRIAIDWTNYRHTSSARGYS